MEDRRSEVKQLRNRTTHIFQLRNPTLYLEEPVVIDESLRGRLEAFEEHDLSKSWSWFVPSSRETSEQDFELLTRQLQDAGPFRRTTKLAQEEP
ncbi:MAG: hypothetical protein BRD28_02015 [Bacteroidetes bacterium QH_10_64_37]|jgi:hypothetical protein|nr:MAG: hypothetical protein BRD28_02015 [Bacteroidetes bacterium QH_10_64_37]